MKKYIFTLFSFLFVFIATAQNKLSTDKLAQQIADRILISTDYSFTNQSGRKITDLSKEKLDVSIKVSSKYLDWHYTNGVTNIALMELAAKSGEKKYLDYVSKNMEFVFNPVNYSYFEKLYNQTYKEGGWMAIRRVNWHMIHRGLRLDDNGPMGASLIDLQKFNGNPAFSTYILETAKHLEFNEPRLEDGTIARIWPHVNTIWADDAFMALSFLVRMGEKTGELKWFDDAANQIINYFDYLWNPSAELYYHCYHTDTKSHGVAHWSRANGWVIMAHADLLKRLPKNHPKRNQLIEIFNKHINGLIKYQGKNGLWHQVLDKVDSYEEITGTAAFVFAVSEGVKNGWLHPDYIYVAEQGLRGIRTLITPQGDVTKICVGTGIMPSLSYYYNRPTTENDPMGEGIVLRALVSMMDAPAYWEVKAEDQYDKIK